MYTEHPLSCSSTGAIGLERTRFFPRQLITPDDLIQDQIYFRDKLRRHNRLLHGWGVVCGARIKKGQGDCDIIIEPGYILGPYGDEIFIDQEVTVNLCQQGTDGNAISPCSDRSDPWCSNIQVDRQSNRPYYLAVRYAECQTRPVRVVGVGCGCNDMECEYSRIRDSYAVKLLSELPSTYADPMPEPNLDDVARCTPDHACPTCPTEPWVILADIQLDAAGKVTMEGIDCFAHRRHVVSFANYYYLCKPTATLPVIGAIVPSNGQVISSNTDLEVMRQWVERPRLAITFDREMATGRLSQPDSWLRLYQLQRRSDIDTDVRRIPLTFFGANPPNEGETGFTAVYDLGAPGTRLLESRFLVQIRAAIDNITDTNTPPNLLDADFGGTTLPSELLDQVWSVTSRDSLPLALWNTLNSTNAALPSGDRTAGGLFYSWFEVFD